MKFRTSVGRRRGGRTHRDGGREIFIFVTGTGPSDPASGELVGDTIERQTEQTIDNISAILEADGASLRDVVKVTVHLSDTSLFARYNAVYARRFSKPYPVRTTVGSDLGHSAGMLIEIDCIALPVREESAEEGEDFKEKAGATQKIRDTERFEAVPQGPPACFAGSGRHD